MDRLSTQDILDARLDDWRKLAQPLCARFTVPDFRTGAAFVTAVAEAAAAADHHPDVRLGHGVVDVSVATHEDGVWITPADVDLARRISEIAAGLGLAADPGAVTQLELALDTAHAALVTPFWSALLTGSADNTVYGSVFDPTGRVPAVWFQETDEHDTPRQRWHVDLWLAPEVADERIRVAVAAGGTVVDDSEAPSFIVLADSDGNRVCVCTSAERD